MKKIILIVCTLVFLISLTACGTKFDGSRTGNDSEFIMEYSVLNTTDAQDLTIEAGDTISAKIVVDKGSLSIKIQKDGENLSMKVTEFPHLMSLMLKLMKAEHTQLK